MGSPRGSLNTTDWQKIGIGALVAVAGALLTYGTAFVMSTDFSVPVADGVLINLTPVVVALWSIVANALRKFLEGHGQTPPPVQPPPESPPINPMA